MAQTLRLSDELIKAAKAVSAVEHRTVSAQIEHWTRIGKCATENPDLTYAIIKDMSIGIAELESGGESVYEFGFRP
ncbi:MAG: hypothetical protein HYV26_18390 [Candidatus Hydrogenedentes bacterium]|nr:hypothetical protein [Candidatus Hydrogenedentota bacterium]